MFTEIFMPELVDYRYTLRRIRIYCKRHRRMSKSPTRFTTFSSHIPEYPLRYNQECLYELSEKPDVQDRLRKELLDFEAEVGRAPAYEEIMGAHCLPYLDAVVREACRTKAVLMEISRVVSIISSQLDRITDCICTTIHPRRPSRKM